MSTKKFGQDDFSITNRFGHAEMDESAIRDVQVMGIINLTDDSFFADSRVLSPSGEFVPETFTSRVRKMVADGASIIDLGACSTRPGSDPVDEETEWKRLEPALKLICMSCTPLKGFRNRQECHDLFEVSIDTFRPEIVRRAYDIIGPFIVNDVSGGSEEMFSAVGPFNNYYIATHSKAMQNLTKNKDVTKAVKEFFYDFSYMADQFGINNWILDPGFGFAKTVEQNWQLLHDLPELQSFGRKILVGVSRKSMIWKPLGITPAEALPGTQVAHLAALYGGADILRVHDVPEAVRTIKLWRLLNGQQS